MQKYITYIIVSTLQRNAHKANQQHIQDSQLQEDGLQPAHSTTDVSIDCVDEKDTAKIIKASG